MKFDTTQAQRQTGPPVPETYNPTVGLFAYAFDAVDAVLVVTARCTVE